MKKLILFAMLAAFFLITSFKGREIKPVIKGNQVHKFTGAKGEVKIMTLDPGHFHAALVQKNMYNQISPEVFVFAPASADLDLHLKRIEGYNTRADKPTSWNEKVYTGPDYFE